MGRSQAAWLAIAGTTALWGLVALGVGHGALLPGLLCAVALCCAADARIRDRFTGKVLCAVSGSGLRATAILIGAMMLWQLVGVELALLMAGDVLAYVEVVAAVSLIAANNRLAPIKIAAIARLGSVRNQVVARAAATWRGPRATRKPRRKTPDPDDGDGRTDFDWAIA